MFLNLTQQESDELKVEADKENTPLDWYIRLKLGLKVSTPNAEEYEFVVHEAKQFHTGKKFYLKDLRCFRAIYDSNVCKANRIARKFASESGNILPFKQLNGKSRNGHKTSLYVRLSDKTEKK